VRAASARGNAARNSINGELSTALTPRNSRPCRNAPYVSLSRLVSPVQKRLRRFYLTTASPDERVDRDERFRSFNSSLIYSWCYRPSTVVRSLRLVGCLHDSVVGATGRTSVYTRQLSARLSGQIKAQSIGATGCADRLLQRLFRVNTPLNYTRSQHHQNFASRIVVCFRRQ